MTEKPTLLPAEVEDALASGALSVEQLRELTDRLFEDEDDVLRFTVDAALISRLGRELVGKQETAVAELIKNAFDADATFVKLYFNDVDSPGGELKVVDDGAGMDRDSLRTGFMRLSTDDKVKSPVSPGFSRTRAGRKGIGRFAVQRLGELLTLTTQVEDSDQAWRLEIDWREFSAGKELTHVPTSLTAVDKEREKGTTVYIRNLREAWDGASLKRVYRYVSDLIQPFLLSDRLEPDSADPGLEVELWVRKSGKITKVFDLRTEVFRHALAEIEGYVDKSGQGVWSLRSERLGINESVVPIGASSEDPSAPYDVLRDVRLTVHYFIYGRGYLPPSQSKLIKEMVSREGGVRVYRNGFRVRPYAEPADDWLNLDASSRARKILPPHANNNFIGFVELVDPEGEYFEETSSREGLIENDAFRELTDFVSRVLVRSALRVAEARGKKQKTSDEGWTPAAGAASESINHALTAVAELTGDLPGLEPKQIQARLKKVTETLRATSKAHKREWEEVLEEMGMFRVLASLGLVMGEFTHEIRQTIGAAFLTARQLSERLPEGSAEQRKAADLVTAVDRFRTYARYFDTTIAENVRRELRELDLAKRAADFLRATEPIAERMRIRVEAVERVGRERPRSCAMHPSELASVLYNLFSNSVKAIRRTGDPGSILLRVGLENGMVFLEMQDTGDGIPEEHRDRVFDAFFTTSSPRSDEDDILSGSGLGLKIVRDIAVAYQGDAFVSEPKDGYSTAVRFELPRGSGEDGD